jgi:hypothetical protein
LVLSKPLIKREESIIQCTDPRIRICNPVRRSTGSGSVSKCHGTGTLDIMNRTDLWLNGVWCTCLKKVTAKKRRLRIRRRICNPIPVYGTDPRTGSVSKCHGTGTLDIKKKDRPLVEWCVVRLLGLDQLVGQKKSYFLLAP